MCVANETSGECASHFQQHLKKYPPQVSSRNAAAGWGCFVHNEINAMLEKPLFDCNNIGDFYDCGCAEDEEGGAEGTKKPSKPAGEDKTHSTGSEAQSGGHEDNILVEISKEE